MKTKSIFTAIICLLMWSAPASAQTYYYNTSKTFREWGFTYICKSEGNAVELYNASNKFTNVRWGMKDGSPTDKAISIETPPIIDKDNLFYNSILKALGEGLTAYEAGAVKRGPVFIIVKIDTDTERVRDVIFEFPANSILATVSPVRYYMIEQNIKKLTCFTLSPAAKKLHFALYNVNPFQNF